jgi:hypothetical protein
MYTFAGIMMDPVMGKSRGYGFIIYCVSEPFLIYFLKFTHFNFKGQSKRTGSSEKGQ